ncbi:MAG: hypothetical protein ABIO04_01525 [Ferruginibacter sp.]
MNQEINPHDSLNINEFEKQKLPTSLNVLTILTFIGCVIGLIGTMYSFTTSKKTYDNFKEAIDSGKMDNAPSWMKGMITPETLVMYQKMHENRMPLLILSTVSILLCFYGALEMRKLKKQGYTFWLIGELLPIAATIIFVGAIAFKGFGLLGICIPLIFIILYTVNRKYLVN